VQITETEIIENRHVLHRDPDLHTSLPFLLFNDGLRELRFAAGLEEWEINELVNVINQSSEVNPLEDDLVILLWEKEFVHIDYLAVDDFLEEAAAMAKEESEDPRPQPTAAEGSPKTPLVSWSDTEPPDMHGAAVDSHHLDVILTPEQQHYLLTPEDILSLQQEVDKEMSPEFVFNTSDIVFDIFALEEQEEPFKDSADVLVRIIDAQVTLGEFSKAAVLLQRVHEALKTPELHYWQTTIVRQLLISLGESERIERIGRLLHRSDAPMEAVAAYLRQLPPNAIPPLISVLENLTIARIRGMLCDILAEIGKSAYEKFLPSLRHSQWFVVRNIAYILGRVGNPRAVPNMAAAFAHKDYRVRREIAHALGMIGGHDAVNLLIKAMGDEHLEVRCNAVTGLGMIHTPPALDALLHGLRDRALRGKDDAEIRAYFDAVGHSQAEEAIATLRELLERHNWFGGGKAEEYRHHAARILAVIGSPAALAVLEAGRRNHNQAIRQACERVLGK